jgi:acyl-CoA synthetase (AMP-forming)/AMP-acid ligase II
LIRSFIFSPFEIWFIVVDFAGREVIIMSPETICAIIATFGTVISAVIAWFVSRSTANKEIDKMRLSWEREDVVSSEDEFAEMASAVTLYTSTGYPRNAHAAAAKVSSVRAKETGVLAASLDELYLSIIGLNAVQVESYLTKVIEQKRKAKSHQK